MGDKVDETHFRSLIGFLMYLIPTRHDILFSMNLLSRLMHCASELHLKVAKRVVRYIKGTVYYGVKYNRGKYFKLFGYSNCDLASSLDDMKSSLEYCFNINSIASTWYSKKHEIVAQTTSEDEFVVATPSIKQTIWLNNILANLGLNSKSSRQIFIDNPTIISISLNSIFHRKSDLLMLNYKLFYLREMQENDYL